MAEANHWFEITPQGRKAMVDQLVGPDERDVLRVLEQQPGKGLELFRRLKMSRWDDLQKVLAKLIRRGWVVGQDRLRMSAPVASLEETGGSDPAFPALKEDWIVLPTLEKNLDLVPPPLSATRAGEVESFENESSSDWERSYQNEKTLDSILSQEDLSAEEALKYLSEDVLEGLRSATPLPPEEELIPLEVPPGEDPTADNAMDLMMAMGLIAQGPKNMLGVPKQALLQKSEGPEKHKQEAKIGSSVSRPMTTEMSDDEEQLMNAIAGRSLIIPVKPKPPDFEVPSYALKEPHDQKDREALDKPLASEWPKVSPKSPPALIMPTPAGGPPLRANNPVLDKQAEILARMQRQAAEREAAASRAKARQEMEAAEKARHQQEVGQQKRMEQVQGLGVKHRSTLLNDWKNKVKKESQEKKED